MYQIVKDGKIDKWELVAALEELEAKLPHADDCPYRHGGECICARNLLLEIIGLLVD